MKLGKELDVGFKALRAKGYATILFSFLNSVEIGAKGVTNNSAEYEIISNECAEYITTRQTTVATQSIETSCVYWEVKPNNTLSKILSEELLLSGIYGKGGLIERVISLNPELKKHNGDHIVPGQVLKMPVVVEVEVIVVPSKTLPSHEEEPKNPFKFGLSTGFASIAAKNAYNDTISRIGLTLGQDFYVNESTAGSIYYSLDRVEFGHDKAFGLSPEVFYNQAIGLSLEKRYGTFSLASNSKLFQFQSLHLNNYSADMRQDLAFSQTFLGGISKNLPGNNEISLKAGPNVTNTKSLKSLNPMIGASAAVELENERRKISVNYDQNRFEKQNSEAISINITWSID